MGRKKILNVEEYDNKLFCPFTRQECLAEKCACSISTESAKETLYFCGFVADGSNVQWSGNGTWLQLNWMKGFYRDYVEEDGEKEGE